MLTIRAAEMDDATAIATVHVDTWRAAYTGILPQYYLDAMTVQNRKSGWVDLLERNDWRAATLVSEGHDGRVVGFVTAGPSRSHRRFFQGEITQLYVLPVFQRSNHGRRLFLAAANRLAEKGYSGLMVWVVAENPARKFYESLGGVQVAETTRSFAGMPLREVAYGWEQIPQYG